MSGFEFANRGPVRLQDIQKWKKFKIRLGFAKQQRKFSDWLDYRGWEIWQSVVGDIFNMIVRDCQIQKEVESAPLHIVIRQLELKFSMIRVVRMS